MTPKIPHSNIQMIFITVINSYLTLNYFDDNILINLIRILHNGNEHAIKTLSNSSTFKIIYEPRHNKTNIVRLRPAWIPTSLRIRAV
jgi:hypothetical protein